MSPHQTIAVAVRLFAIWLLIYFGRIIPPFYRQAANADDSKMLLAVAVVSLGAFLFVLYLWFFPRTVARGLLDTKSTILEEPASPDTWFAIGCSLLGLWLMLPALAAVGYNLLFVYAAQRDPALDASQLQWSYYFIEIAFGIWLLLGAKAARRLFWWARNRE